MGKKKICVHQWEKNGWKKRAKYILHLYIFVKYVSHKHTQVSFRHKKEGNSAIYNNMCRIWEHYAKWNKSERERQELYDLTYMWNLTKQNQTQKKGIQTQIREQTGGGLRQWVESRQNEQR